MKLGTGSALRAFMWSLSIGLFVSLGGITLSGCASGDKDKGSDEMASDDGDKKDTKKKKKKKKKKKAAPSDDKASGSGGGDN